MRHIIEVTRADIDAANAQRKARIERSRYKVSGADCDICPIAQALLRQFPFATGVDANPDSCRVERGSYNRTHFKCQSTLAIRRFMRRWDRTWQASPTRFLVDAYIAES